MLDDVVIDVIDNEYILTVTGNHVLTIEWEKIIVLPTIAEVRALSKGTETEFVGVVTGFTDYSEQHSNFDKVFIEDSTAAIVVYRAGFPQDLKVGDRYKVTGELDSFNGLVQIAQGATVEKLESDIELIAPVEVTDLTEINESYQGKRVDLEGTVVSVSSTGQELVVKVGEKQITVRSNSDSADHTVNSHLLTATVGQVVKLHEIHVDWFNGSQLLPTLVEQVEFVMPSDEELAQLVLNAIVNEWENKSFNMGTDATLPQTGDHDSTITWTFASEGIIVEGKWSDVTADTTYAVTVVVTIGDEEVYKVFDITVKFVDGEVAESTTVTATYPSGSGTTNMTEGNNAETIGLDPSIFYVESVERESSPLHVGLNNSGQIRLYGSGEGNGNILSIEIAEIYKISKVKFVFGGTVNPALIKSGDNELHNGVLTSNSSLEFVDLDTSLVSIKNIVTGGTGQIYILSIEITYVGGEDIEPVVKHEVSFNSDGGSVVESQTINEGSKANRPVDPTKEGFDFMGWFLNDELFDFGTLITEPITLTAHWEEAEPVELIEDASVEFSFDNLTSKGTGVSGTYLTDKYKDTLLSDIIISGSVYDGNGSSSTNYENATGLIKFGTGSATGGLKFVFNENVLIKTIIIYAAGWTASEGQLRVNGINPAGESSLADIETRYVIVLDEATNEITIGTSSKRAFLFAVGFYGPEAEVPAAPVITEWEVSFDLGYDGSPVMEPVIVEDEKAVNEPSKPSREGFVFVEWRLDGVAYDFNELVTNDLELVAIWELYVLPETHYLETIDFVNDYTDDLPTFIGGNFDGRYADKGLKFSSDDHYLVISNLSIDGPALIIIDLTLNPAGGDGTNELLIKDAEGNLLGSQLMDTGKVEVYINPETTLTEISISISRKDNASIHSVEIVKTEELAVHTVTFNYNDELTTNLNVEVAEGFTVTEPVKPIREGYVFNGWMFDGVEYDFNHSVTSDIELIASWEEEEEPSEGTFIETFGQVAGGQTSYTTEETYVSTDNGFTWSMKGRNDQTLDGKAWVLGNAGDGSFVQVVATGGIKSFSLDVVRAFGNSHARTLELFVNDVSYGTFSVSTSSDDKQVWEVDNINVLGNVTIKVISINTGSRGATIIDNFTWSEYVDVVEPPVQHIVTFDSDGGSAVPAQTINEGSKANRPVDPTKEGFNFLGWFIGENEFDFDTLITEAITLTAHWEEAEPVVEYTITFYDDEGILLETLVVVEGEMPSPQTPTKAETATHKFEFDGWDPELVVASEDAIYHATFKATEKGLYDYTETFDASTATASYADGSFTGVNGVVWTFVQSRDENGDANNSGIEGNAIMLRRASDNSSIKSSKITGGISYFEVKLYKGFTGNGNRQVEVFINGVSIGKSIAFDDFNEHILIIENLNIEGDFVIEIKNITSNQVILDNISWNSSQKPETDEEKIIADSKSLKIVDFINSAIIIDLVTEGNYGSTISWTSSHENIISNNGVVVLPSETTKVTLTAELTLGELTQIEVFQIEVLGMTDILEIELELLEQLPVTVTTNLDLVLKTLNGYDIVWTSSDIEFITHDGLVTRPSDVDVTVTMTASIVGYPTIFRTFELLVLAQGEEIETELHTATIKYEGNQIQTDIPAGVISNYLTFNQITGGTNNIQVQFTHGTGNNNIFNNGSKQIRLYAGGKLTISVVEAKITKIEWSSSQNDGITVNGISNNNNNDSIVFEEGLFELDIVKNGSGQFRINNLTITYESNVDSKPEEPGDEVEVTTEYIFTSNSWGTSQDDWTSGKGGNQYESGRGIQVTSKTSGANGTTNITFYNVKSIEITYSTNSSSGAGTIVTKVGNETVQTFTVSTTDGTTNRSAGVINVDSLDGAITITVNCTTNSIYLYGIKIAHTES